jgi:hypothetical protein
MIFGSIDRVTGLGLRIRRPASVSSSRSPVAGYHDPFTGPYLSHRKEPLRCYLPSPLTAPKQRFSAPPCCFELFCQYQTEQLVQSLIELKPSTQAALAKTIPTALAGQTAHGLEWPSPFRLTKPPNAQRRASPSSRMDGQRYSPAPELAGVIAFIARLAGTPRHATVVGQ